MSPGLIPVSHRIHTRRRGIMIINQIINHQNHNHDNYNHDDYIQYDSNIIAIQGLLAVEFCLSISKHFFLTLSLDHSFC